MWEQCCCFFFVCTDCFCWRCRIFLARGGNPLAVCNLCTEPCGVLVEASAFQCSFEWPLWHFWLWLVLIDSDWLREWLWLTRAKTDWLWLALTESHWIWVTLPNSDYFWLTSWIHLSSTLTLPICVLRDPTPQKNKSWKNDAQHLCLSRLCFCLCRFLGDPMCTFFDCFFNLVLVSLSFFFCFSVPLDFSLVSRAGPAKQEKSFKVNRLVEE